MSARVRALDACQTVRLTVDLPRARAILFIARAAGCEFALSGSRLDFDIPPKLAKRLRDALMLHIGLNAKAIGALIEAET
ncbi:MAG TPA: hypothetical protein VGG77_10235 [Roseiarcus sp.]|jgi:hypothetical protein